MQLQVSAQTYDQKISNKNNVSVFSRMDGKAGTSNTLGAFAKILDGLRGKVPQNRALPAGTESTDTGVQQLAGQKKTSKTIVQTKKTFFVIDGTAQTPVENKKKKSSHQQETGGIDVLFVNKTHNSAGQTRKTVASPSGTEYIKKEISANVLAVTASQPFSVQTQEAAIAAAGAKDAKSTAALLFEAGSEIKIAESPTKTGRQKKEIIPIANEIPQREAAEQTIRLNEGHQSAKKTEDELKAVKTKRKERFTVEMHDTRTVDTAMAQTHSLQVNAVHTDADTAEITLDLNQGRTHDVPETGFFDKTDTSRNFTDMLSHTLVDTLSSDIVRQAAIVLRDGGQGMIRLSLKPETLGSVKIRLELAENKITGNIIVDSEEAYRAFEKEVHTLEQAFKDNGFESANLNTTFASGDGRNGRQWDDSERQYFSERLVAEHYDALTIESRHSLESSYESEKRVAINMLA
ncbi:MAG: flagellar hook-length control protein FliK [Treponema sp.]|nr:flagellar hook-length control protein FliK [Treponema sp.]